MDKDYLLQVDNLHVSFDTYAGEVMAVRGAELNVERGETLAIVGESGCGKSVTAQAIMRLSLDNQAQYKEGSILFEGRDVLTMSKKEVSELRGGSIGMILQDPLTSLNPTMTVGKQIAEGIIKHQKLNKQEAIARSIELLELVGIPNPEERVKEYPHQFSGGMRQRVSIAVALACNPKLLIADEPTTALDVTIQAQILELMKNLQNDLGTSIILITHDLGIVADMADHIVIMYAGKVIESGTYKEIFYDPRHPYTWGLLGSVPRVDTENKSDLMSIHGSPPDLHAEIKGCPFRMRCNYEMSVCSEEAPEKFEVGGEHCVACWLEHEFAPAVDNPITGRKSKSDE